MPRWLRLATRPAISDRLAASLLTSRTIALPVKNSGDVLLHLSSSASQSVIGADGASTKAMNERPRKRRDVRGRAAVARFTREPPGRVWLQAVSCPPISALHG